LGNWFGLTARLGDYVWKDLNANGRMDSGEPGVAGVTVNLLDAAGGFVAGTTTDSYGHYKFHDLSPGAYMVQFVKPSGFVFTTPNVGDDALDSDADAITGRTGAATLGAGEDNPTINAGLVSNFHGVIAAPSFWTTAKGQNLLKLLNVTSTAKAGTSTALGTWLGKNFGNLYNITATPNYFYGKSTAAVAARYIQLYNADPASADVGVLSLALSMYVTTTGLNSASLAQAAAQQAGFVLSAQGSAANLRNKVWDLGDNGEAFATVITTTTGTGKKKVTITTPISADNEVVTVWTALQRTNQYASNGVLWAKPITIGGVVYAPATLQAQGRDVFSAINALGTILL
jgi:hypothetical protein